MDVPAKGNVLGRYVPARYILAILGSIAMAIVYGLKVNLSVAMVGMLNHTAIKMMSHEGNHSNITVDECAADHVVDVREKDADGPFNWSTKVQGLVLSCYFWGYIISQIPGGRIAEVFSGKWVMFFSVCINVVCTLLTPVAARWHHVGLVLMRVGEGLGGGVTFPAMHVLLSKWAPPAERGVMAALVYAGTSLGTVISMLMAGLLTAKLGWESVFYVMGGLSTIWCVLWVVLVKDTPWEQPYISEEERHMIVTSLGGKQDENRKLHSVPWRSVVTSGPFLAILVAHTCSNWGWYLLLIELPFFIKQVLHFNTTENAVTTALPFLLLWLFSMTLSKTLETLRNRLLISTTIARKIGTLCASVIPALCLLALCFTGCSPIVAVALTSTAVVSVGGMFCGFLSNHIDIAPNYAGTLVAVTNTIATIPGILVPMFVGYVTDGDQTMSAWRKVFYVTIALYVVEIFMYTTYGSGEEQRWNDPANEMEEDEMNQRQEERGYYELTIHLKQII